MVWSRSKSVTTKPAAARSRESSPRPAVQSTAVGASAPLMRAALTRSSYCRRPWRRRGSMREKSPRSSMPSPTRAKPLSSRTSRTAASPCPSESVTCVPPVAPSCTKVSAEVYTTPCDRRAPGQPYALALTKASSFASEAPFRTSPAAKVAPGADGSSAATSDLLMIFSPLADPWWGRRQYNSHVSSPLERAPRQPLTQYFTRREVHGFL